MNKNINLPGKKFLFDLNDFDEEAIRAKAALARRPTFSQEELAAARESGFEEGRIAGLQEAINSQEAQIRDLVQQMVISAERLSTQEADRTATFIDQAALVAVQALVRTLPVLLDTLSVEQIANFTVGVLEGHVGHQSIVIHVPPVREQAVTERLHAMAANMRRKQDWTIQPDPKLHDLQCRIEWSGGGAQWDPNIVAARLLETIVGHLPDHLKPQVATPIEDAAMDEAPQTPHTDEPDTAPKDGGA
ncbi:MAG: hypothetical protein H6865_05705 [Rhodospirillales bacterium]|nr:hypothetical protein [Alphaproteobacteria bacterium]MCB9987116.1 hypothetical protein [Rhodospirillales bacterium]USO08125.1 MAG: hypothetical protein H6866_02590 [Rhodospirillales bacterium]